MFSSAGDSFHSDTGGDPNITPFTNETPGGSDSNPLTDTPISDKTPTVTDQNLVPVANPLSDTSPSDKSPTVTDSAAASPLSDRAAIVEVLLRFGFKLIPARTPSTNKPNFFASTFCGK